MRRAIIVLASFAIAAVGILAIGRQPDWASARALQCSLGAALLAVLAWQVRGWFRNGAMVLCSLTAGLTICEAAALAMRPAAGPAHVIETDTGVHGGRPFVGWGALSPGVYHTSKIERNGHVDYDTHVTIDEHLDRKTTPSTGLRPIAFFGDSWVFGAGLNDDGTLPQIFAGLNHGAIPVLNLGYLGWSPAVNLIALRTGLYKNLLVHPRHFILFAASFHVERTACRAGYRFSGAPRFIRIGDRLDYEGSCADIGGRFLKPVYDFARRFALYDDVAPYFAQPTRDDVETFIAIVEAFVARAKRDYGIETTVLMPPQGDNLIAGTGYTVARIAAQLRKAGDDVMMDDLPKIANPDLYLIEDDGHPTALANQATARAIEAHIEAVDPAALEAPAGP